MCLWNSPHSSILPVFLPNLEHVWHSLPSHQTRKFHSRNSSQLLAFHHQFVDFVCIVQFAGRLYAQAPSQVGGGGRREGRECESRPHSLPVVCHPETLRTTPQEVRRTKDTCQCLWHGPLGCEKAKLMASLSVGKSEGCETKTKTHSLRAMNYSSKPSL